MEPDLTGMMALVQATLIVKQAKTRRPAVFTDTVFNAQNCISIPSRPYYRIPRMESIEDTTSSDSEDAMDDTPPPLPPVAPRGFSCTTPPPLEYVPP